MTGCGAIISAQDEMASAVADISATDPSEIIATRSANDPAVLQSRHQQVANQRCNPDCNSGRHHRTRHRFLSCRTLNCALQKRHAPATIRCQIRLGPFIEHSSGM
jgi:hypothetical protein